MRGLLFDPRNAARRRPKDVTKADIIDQIAEGTGLTRIETEAVVNGFITTVMAALREGESVDFRGFGSFRVQHRAPRLARNPQTNEQIEVEERYQPTFKPARDFQQAVDQAMKARKRS